VLGSLSAGSPVCRIPKSRHRYAEMSGLLSCSQHLRDFTFHDPMMQGSPIPCSLDFPVSEIPMSPSFRGFPRNLNCVLLSRNFRIRGFVNPPQQMFLLQLPGSRIPICQNVNSRWASRCPPCILLQTDGHDPLVVSDFHCEVPRSLVIGIPEMSNPESLKILNASVISGL
jgi:hypothetical protein